MLLLVILLLLIHFAVLAPPFKTIRRVLRE